MDEIGLEVGSRAFRFPHVKMLFHAPIACSFPFVILIEETKLRFRIIFFTQLWNWVFLVRIIFGCGNLIHFSRIGKITFCSISNTTFIYIVISDVTSYQALILSFILMGNLSLDFINMGWLCKSTFISYTKFLITKWSVLIRRVCSAARWTASCKIYISSRKPSQFSSISKIPFRVWSIFWYHDILTCHSGEIVIGCTRSIEIGAHCLMYLLLSSCIINSSKLIIHRRFCTICKSRLLEKLSNTSIMSCVMTLGLS